MKRIAIILTLALTLLRVSAQEYSSAVTLESQTGSEVILRATDSERKGKEAETSAVESAFKVLFHNGLADLKGEQPLLGGPAEDYEYRFFANKRYLAYLTGKPKKISETKYGGEKRVTFDVPINLQALVKDMESAGVPLSHAWASPKKESPSKGIDPTIVVVPLVADGGGFEQMRDLIQTNPAAKQSVNTLTAAFASRGFKTRDFTTALQNAATDDLLRQDAQTDLKTMVVQNLPGDIVVTADAQINTSADGRTYSCQLNIKAVERQTESLLASENFNSGKYHLQDPAMLVDHAVKTIGESFFSQLSAAFNDMAKNGRQIALEFQLGEGVDWEFDEEAPGTGDDFMEALEEWIRDNCFQGTYNMGLSTSKFIKASVNTPLWDMEKNRAAKITNFTTKLKKFLRTQLGDEYKPEITSLGQRVLVTVK